MTEPLPASRPAYLAAACVWAWLALALVIGFWDPPAPSAGGFSLDRARRHVAEIARAPHPIGTAAHRAVESYLVSTLRGYPGIEADTQVAGHRAGERVAYVRNVVARLTGEDAARAVLLVAHYDSTIVSPGAADNGAGVAALLEAARVLSAGTRPRNSVIFLFSDGEELGAVGARVFAAQHPWMPSVRAVVNFDARGTHGPSMMFQSGRRDSWIVREYFRSAPSPRATSLMPELFEYMPNGTDFAVFRDRGLPGLNFAFAEDWERYHSNLDSPAILSDDSLTHHGINAVALATALSGRALEGSAEPLAYFDVAGTVRVIYPTWIGGGLLVVAIVLAVVAWVMGRRQHVHTWRGLAFAFALIAASTAAAIGTGMLLIMLAPQQWTENPVAAYNSGWFVAANALLPLAVGAAVWAWGMRRTAPAHLLAGAIVWFALFAAAATWIAPGAAYVWLLPALCGAAALLLIAWTPAALVDAPGRLVLVLILLTSVVLILSRTTDQLVTAFTARYAYGTSLLLVPLLAFVTPPLAIALRRKSWLLPLGLAAIGLAAGLVAMTGATFTPVHPRQNHLLHVTDLDAGTRNWVTLDQRIDAWTSRIFGDRPTREALKTRLPPWYRGLPNRMVVSAQAPAASVSPPEVSVLSVDRSEAAPVVTLLVRSTRQAPELTLRVSSSGGAVQVEDGAPDPASAAVRLMGRLIANTRADGVVIYCYGVPNEGVRVRLRMTSIAPLRVELVERSYDLPVGVDLPARSDAMIPQFIGDGTVTLRSVELPIVPPAPQLTGASRPAHTAAP
jgi:hypothetical protein